MSLFSLVLQNFETELGFLYLLFLWLVDLILLSFFVSKLLLCLVSTRILCQYYSFPNIKSIFIKGILRAF